jgi:hypothetical protein
VRSSCRPRCSGLCSTAASPAPLLRRLHVLARRGHVGHVEYIWHASRPYELGPRLLSQQRRHFHLRANPARRVAVTDARACIAGPSMMPGGTPESYETLRPIVEKVAAQTDSGPCVTYVGPGGSGNFVKMARPRVPF